MESINFLLISDIQVDHISKNILGKTIDEVVLHTPFGASGKILIFEIGGFRGGFLSRHEGNGNLISKQPVNYKANIYAGRELGAQRIISWNSVHPINSILMLGDYLVPDDFIDATKRRDYTYFVNKGFGFVKQNPAFCPELRRELINQAQIYEERSFDVGIYLCIDSPQIKTETEKTMFSQWGVDIFGDTLTPEIYLAKELEMCYASICFVNYPSKKQVHHRPDFKDSAKSGGLGGLENAHINPCEILSRLTRDVIKKLSLTHNCSCSKTMESYKLRGDIGEDWHEWVRP